MKRFIILLLLSLFIHEAGAGPVTNLTATPQYNMSGYVYDFDTGGTLFNSVVFLSDGFVEGSTFTNISGGFTLQGISNGTYTITAQKDNYINYSVPVLIDGADVTGLEFYL